jgi:hypothetical protein
MRRNALLGTLTTGLLLAACGGEDDDGVDIPLAQTAGLEPAEVCQGASSSEDPAGDSTGPTRDLVRFEMHASQEGVCVRWTTDTQALVGTKLVLVIHGPWQTTASGGSVSHGYGFDVALTEDGAEVSYGLGDLASNTPNVLDARVGQTGDTVSAFVPRSELDRPPANMPDRPPFPYDGTLTVEARVSDAVTEDIVDSWPDDPGTEAAYVNGQLCPPPCMDPAVTTPPQPQVVP